MPNEILHGALPNIMSKINLEEANALNDSFKRASKVTFNCQYPKCDKKAINSHIFQKNGILSEIINEKKEVIDFKINQFNENTFLFGSLGWNKAFSFPCFCQEHDDNLFKPIEKNESLDFTDYNTCILFNVRLILNEIFRKKVLHKRNDILLDEYSELFDSTSLIIDNGMYRLAITELENTMLKLWNDLTNNTQLFHFDYRTMDRLDICMSAMYNPTTSESIMKNIFHVPDIFINLFPISKSESILLMSYEKSNEPYCKQDLNTYFKEKEKRVQRKITNLIVFHCETWVISEKLFKNRIERCEQEMVDAAKFSIANSDSERRNYDINLWLNNFPDKLKSLTKTFGNIV
jgi:hypothetical protein